MYTVYIFVLGLVLGSFYTVVGLRRPEGESIISPGSHCTKCNHKLAWYDLIPVLSFLFRRGRCGYCQEKISWMYPCIEILTGTLFALSYYLYGFSYECFAMMVISSILILIYVSDFTYMIILDGPIIFGIVAVFALKWWAFGWKPALLAALSGIIMFVIMLFIKFIGDKMFQKESLGGGDIKLSFFIGIVLGVRLSLISLVISCIVALPYALYVVLTHKEKEIPFGPFLITSLLFTFIFMSEITNFLQFLYVY